MTEPLLNVYNLTRQKVAIIQNAFNITEEQELNNIYTLSFTIPSNDPKKDYCKPFYFVRYGDGELYRIVGEDATKNDTGTITYNCEHAIATLCDNVMFGSFTYGSTNIHTGEVINWILSQQTVKNWVLNECDFDYQFEYGWEQENLLNALYSIPKEFVNPYKWVFDTSSYPWRISLKQIDITAHPNYYIRAKKNLLDSQETRDFTDICTRIYPLGYGEGVNQLTIRDVNNGVPYLEASADVIARYGRKEKVLVDRSFENAESLKAFAQQVLNGLQTPSMSRKFNVVDLYPITSKDIDNAEVGKICELTDDKTITYITKTTRVLDEAGNLQIELSTKSNDVATTIADLAERVRIESVYSQGATQLYQHSKDANATPSKGMILSLYFPSEMKQINKVLLRMQLKRFRSYSQTTNAGGAFTQTSSGGSASGSTSQATGSGSFSATVTSDAVWTDDYSWVKAQGEGAGLTYTTANANATSPHNHTVQVNPVVYLYKYELAHTHNVSLSSSVTSHTHAFNVGAHTHSVSIPSHTHSISAGIFESGSPSGFDVYIHGQKINNSLIEGTSFEDDITLWLLDSSGDIPRGTWIDLEIRPNDLAYVVASVFVQGFIQSRGGGNY